MSDEIVSHFITVSDREYRFNVGMGVVIAFRWLNGWKVIGVWRTKIEGCPL